HRTSSPDWRRTTYSTAAGRERDTSAKLEHRFLQRAAYSARSLQFVAQDALFDQIHTLFVIVTGDDEQILFRLVQTIQPTQLSDQCVFVFLNPGRASELFLERARWRTACERLPQHGRRVHE